MRLNSCLKLRLFLLLATAFSLPSAFADKVDGYSYVLGNQLDFALDMPLPRFVLDTQDLPRFVEDFRLATGIALCAELAGESAESEVAEAGDTPALTPLPLENTTPRQILDAFTLARPDYAWLHVAGNRVNLLPKAYLDDPAWRGHLPTGTWSAFDIAPGNYFQKIANFTQQSEEALTTTSATRQVQPAWAKHPRLLNMRRATIQNRDATLLEALNATSAFGPDFVWTLNGHIYHFDIIPLDEVYPAAFQRADELRKQPDASPEAVIALYQMAWEEAPYTDLKVRIGLAILDIYLGRGMVNAQPQPELAVQMCRLLIDAQPPYPYDETLWRQYLGLLYGMGKERDAQWAVRALCPPGAAQESYPCMQAKSLTLWMTELYPEKEDKIRYLISKQNVFPDDPLFNDLIDAQALALQNTITLESQPPANPYAQFNQFKTVKPEDAEEMEEGDPPAEVETEERDRKLPRRVKR